MDCTWAIGGNMKYIKLLGMLFLIFSLVSCISPQSQLSTPTYQVIASPTVQAKIVPTTANLPLITPPKGLVYCTDYCSNYWEINVDGTSRLIASIPSADGAVLSHDKQSLLYYANSNIQILNLQTQESRDINSSGFDATWSPDDTKIAFIHRPPGQNVWVVDLATGQQHNLTNTTRWLERGFCCDSDIFERILWSQFAPNTIFFASQTPETPVVGSLPQVGSDFYPTIVNTDGSNYRIIDDVNGSFFSPRVSPDGHYLAYDGGATSTIGGLLYDLRTNQRIHILASDYGVSDPPDLRLVSPRWSPDGRKILWMAGNSNSYKARIILFDLDKHAATVLRVYDPTIYNVGIGDSYGTWWPGGNNFYWSPDGKWIVLVTDTWDLHESNPNYGGRLQIFDSNGNLFKELYADSIGVPIWSPDNQSMAYNYLEYNNQTQYRYDAIRILDINSWEVKGLNLPKLSQVVDWLP